MFQNGQNQKLGLRTSLRDMLQSNSQTITNMNNTQVRKQVISVNKNASGATNPHIVIKAPLTTEQLKETKYINNSFGVNNVRTDLHFNYNPNTSHSNFVPPPPSRFLVSSGHQSNGVQPSQLPIQSNHIQTIQTFHQPLYQSIRKTYIPHHVINQIPIMDSQTKYYAENQQGYEANQEIDQNDAKMLEQYEKLYQKYLQELEKSQSYLRKIQSLEHQIRSQQQHPQPYNPKPQIREIVQTKQVYITKPTKVDTKQLISILMKKIKPMMDQTFQRKKASCLSKLKNLLNQQQSIIKTTVMRSSQQLTVKYKHH